ncbi:MAG: alpha/beta fold hydrolase [Candidatus Micrarchaeia archaeon]
MIILHGTRGHPEENWFPWLKKELELRGCKVFVPQFPTPENQTPESWFAVFEKYRKYFTPDTILVGHSLGGTFALRILEASKIKIMAAFLVAAPVGILPTKNYEADRPFVEKRFDWEKIRKNCREFVVFHSEDDQLVSVENGRELAGKLDAGLILLKNAGHFNAKAGYTKFEKLLEVMERALT